jgi:hypothetical protein
MEATIVTYNGGMAHHVTGKIKREYSKGLTIEDERGVVYYAPFENVKQRETRGYLW